MSMPESVKRTRQNHAASSAKHRNDAFSDKTIGPDCAIARGGKSGNFLGLATLPQGALAVIKDASLP